MTCTGECRYLKKQRHYHVVNIGVCGAVGGSHGHVSNIIFLEPHHTPRPNLLQKYDSHLGWRRPFAQAGAGPRGASRWPSSRPMRRPTKRPPRGLSRKLAQARAHVLARADANCHERAVVLTQSRTGPRQLLAQERASSRANRACPHSRSRQSSRACPQARA